MSLAEVFMELDKLYDQFENEPSENKANEYLMLKQGYDTKKVFNDRDKESGNIADLINELESKNIPYDQYKHKTDKGITIFYNKFN